MCTRFLEPWIIPGGFLAEGAGEAAAEAAYAKIGFRGAGVQVNYMDKRDGRV